MGTTNDITNNKINNNNVLIIKPNLIILLIITIVITITILRLLGWEVLCIVSKCWHSLYVIF